MSNDRMKTHVAQERHGISQAALEGNLEEGKECVHKETHIFKILATSSRLGWSSFESEDTSTTTSSYENKTM